MAIAKGRSSNWRSWNRSIENWHIGYYSCLQTQLILKITANQWKFVIPWLCL
jgi:hypothetical protein